MNPPLALALGSLLLLALSGCTTKHEPTGVIAYSPEPTVSQYLETESGGFVFRRGQGNAFKSCRYVVILKPRQRSETTLYLRTRFEDPAHASRTLELDSELAPGQDSIQLESPPVRGLRPSRSYLVEVVIFDSPARTHAIGLHRQLVQSLVSF